MKRVLEQTVEIARTIGGFFSSICFPVRTEYCFDERDISRGVVNDQRDTKTNLNDQIRIVSWNILRGYHQDKINASLSQIIRDYNPDLVILQEAPVRDQSSLRGNDLYSHWNIAYAPLHQVARKSDFYDFEHSGQLTLGRISYQEVEVHALPPVARQSLGGGHLITRVALYTQTKCKDGTRIGVYNVHLENRTGSSGRQYQMRRLLEIMEKKNDDIVVVGGDFNTFLGLYLEKGIADLENAGFTKGFVKRGITPQLDHFFYRGEKINRVDGKQLNGKGSDHQPMLLELE